MGGLTGVVETTVGGVGPVVTRRRPLRWRAGGLDHASGVPGGRERRVAPAASTHHDRPGHRRVAATTLGSATDDVIEPTTTDTVAGDGTGETSGARWTDHRRGRVRHRRRTDTVDEVSDTAGDAVDDAPVGRRHRVRRGRRDHGRGRRHRRRHGGHRDRHRRPTPPRSSTTPWTRSPTPRATPWRTPPVPSATPSTDSWVAPEPPRGCVGPRRARGRHPVGTSTVTLVHTRTGRPVTPRRVVAGRYRLEERIGSGAMGVVWRGTDERLGRVVAVKQVFLNQGLDESEADEVRQRTLREGRIAARLQHPHAISVFDASIEGDEPWLVMEYLPSRSLAAVLGEQGPLDPRLVARIGRQVADALDAAHEAGIVHRDVKPGNVLIGADGTVKITDFGISRATGRPHAHPHRHARRHARLPRPRGRPRARTPPSPRTCSRWVRRSTRPSRACRPSGPTTTRSPCSTPSRPARCTPRSRPAR